MLQSHILSLITFIPLVGAAAVVALPQLQLARAVAMGFSLAAFALAMYLWVIFDGSTPALQFVEAYEWLPQFGIKFILGVDGFSILLVVLTTFLMPLVLLSLWNSHDTETRQRYFIALLLALQSAMLGALLAFDLVFFYVFWEAMLIPMYFIIGIWGGSRRIYATTKFVLYTFVGSLLMLAAAVALYLFYYMQTGVYTTSLLDLYQVRLPMGAQSWLFGAFALAFAIKVPLWPLHTWLPDAHVEAPTVGSVILAGVMLKMGTYGLIRFAIPLFPSAVAEYAPFFVFLGVTGIIYGALTAWVQKDAKKMVAYSSVSHLGFVVVGSFAVMSTGGLSVEALTGATYQMINHGISTGALFFLVGVIYERRHTRMLDQFGGLAANMPWFAVLLIVATLSSVGLPGTGGFVGEFLILNGLFQAMPLAGILASLGVLLGAVYMLTLCRKILFGPLDKPENKELKDVSALELSYLAPFAILAIVMGIFPSLFIGKTKASIEHLARNYQHYRLEYQQVSEMPSSTDRSLVSEKD
jgi:NADH-quinone oxidoreductase subunit M